MKPVLLCILDGWGVRPIDDNNGIKAAIFWPTLLEKYPHTLLQASESFVGLPAGQMGNSEVGHMTIGLGRKLMQDLPKISDLIETEELFNSPAIQALVKDLQISQKTCHVVGLLSDGGVHSHQDHIVAICEYLHKNNVNVALHALLDGRDTHPKSADTYLKAFQEQLPGVQIASISGRFYTMDRDQRWDRIEHGYKAMVCVSDNRFNNPLTYIEESYAKDISDEFIIPASHVNYRGMQAGDALFTCNFRADRMRQIMRALLFKNFDHFTRCNYINFSHVVSLGQYAEDIDEYTTCIVPRTPLEESLGETIARAGMRQLRIAETEKYAHVTFFFNGGQEAPLEGEERILVPSPQVKTYDLKPEMSADEVTSHVLSALNSKKFELIVLNFANPDMVGHTGVKEAIFKAVKTVDQCLEKLTTCAKANDVCMIITADHGNVEKMEDDGGSPHTAHTTDPVPFVLINGPQNCKLQEGTLADISPTILELIGIKKPNAMTGRSLIRQ